MLANELRELVRSIRSIKAESPHVEVKAAHKGYPKKLYPTLSSFANHSGGGTLVFGLDETQGFTTVGVYDPQDLQQQVTAQCNQMSPVVRPLFTTVELDGKVIVAAEIPEVDTADKPCFYQGAGRMRGSYVRVGDADEPMTDYEIYSYEAFRKKHQDDIRIVERAQLNSLDASKLQLYIHTVKQSKPNLSHLPLEQLYELLGITLHGEPTLAAVMIFSPFPQAYFPQFGITAIVVPGYTIGDIGDQGERFLDNKRIEGSIPEMLEGALLFVQKSMSTRTIIDPQTGQRRDKVEYPLQAIREALLNALVHRDYSHHSEGTPVQLIFFKDRLEIHNSGGLYGRLTLSELGRVRPDTRNPVMANMLEVLKICENRYSGIPTIRREMENAGLLPPEFKNERGNFAVVLYNSYGYRPKDLHVAENRDAVSLLDFCAIPRSRNEIAAFLQLTTNYYAMQNYVLPLVDQGLLALTIPDKPRSRNQKYVAVGTLDQHR
ncbi:MAG: hypothetical protein DDT30_01529 [Dehalococcoidia bacterium]|nr:hypothetical protein [Bacillota bacterium]